MIWFAVFFAPALLTAVMLLERLENQLLAARPERPRDQGDLATMLQIGYPRLAEPSGHAAT